MAKSVFYRRQENSLMSTTIKSLHVHPYSCKPLLLSLNYPSCFSATPYSYEIVFLDPWCTSPTDIHETCWRYCFGHLVSCRYFETVKRSLQPESGNMSAAQLNACFRELTFWIWFFFLLFSWCCVFLQRIISPSQKINYFARIIWNRQLLDALVFTMESDNKCVQDIPHILD